MLKDYKQGIKFEFATDASQCYGQDMREAVKELNGYLTKLSNIYTKEQNNFAEFCYYVFKINEFFSYKSNKTKYGLVYTKDKKMIRFREIMLNIGIDDSQASRILSCYEKYVTKETDKPMLFAEFFGFTKSKLFELLVVDVEQLKLDIQNQVLRPDFSVLRIREYVKNYKAQQKQNKKLKMTDSEIESLKNELEESYDDFDESEIEMAYDPKKHYDFKYFEAKSKSQLLNIIMQLQKEYENLKKEKTK